MRKSCFCNFLCMTGKVCEKVTFDGKILSVIKSAAKLKSMNDRSLWHGKTEDPYCEEKR